MNERPPPTPIDELGSRSADYLISFGILRGYDPDLLSRELIESLSTATIGYLMQAAQERGLGEALAAILIRLVPDEHSA